MSKYQAPEWALRKLMEKVKSLEPVLEDLDAADSDAEFIRRLQIASDCLTQLATTVNEISEEMQQSPQSEEPVQGGPIEN